MALPDQLCPDFFRTISCFYPPNPLGFCFSHPEVPETPAASHEFFGESQAQMNVWSALHFSEVTGRSSQNELSGVGNDWGCGTQVFIALKSGRKGWAEMCRVDGASVTCRDFSGDWIRYAVCTPIASSPPSSWSPLSSQLLLLWLCSKISQIGDYTGNQIKIWLYVKIMESMKRLRKTSLIILARLHDFTVKFNLM